MVMEAKSRPEPRGPTRVDVAVEADRALARLDVTRIGSELPDAMRMQLDRLERSGIATVYVDLPLSLPETPHACDELERLGLSFAGVYPAAEDAGWRLRLQLLDPHAKTERDEIEVASDFGAELRDYVLDPPTAGRAASGRHRT